MKSNHTHTEDLPKAEDLRVLGMEIALKKRHGKKKAVDVRKKCPLASLKPKQLPCLSVSSNYFAGLDPQNTLTPSAWQQQIVLFAISNGVAPVLAAFRTSCYTNAVFMDRLQCSLPTWPYLSNNVKATGKQLAEVAAAILQGIEISETREEFVNLANWIIVLFQKNKDTFFVKIRMEESDALQLCARLPIMVCEDLAFDAEDVSFFKVLLAGPLADPMTQDRRSNWEAHYRPTFSMAQHASLVTFQRHETEAQLKDNLNLTISSPEEANPLAANLGARPFNDMEQLIFIDGFRAEMQNYEKNRKFSFFNISACFGLGVNRTV